MYLLSLTENTPCHAATRFYSTAGITNLIPPLLDFPSAAVLGLIPPVWLISRGEVLHDRTGGEYDVVIWDARGQGASYNTPTMYVVYYLVVCHRCIDASTLTANPLM